MSHLTIQLFTIWFQHTEKSTNVSNVWQPQRPHLATFKVLLPLVVFSAWWVCGDFARFWIVLTSWVEIGWHFLLFATANCETVLGIYRQTYCLYLYFLVFLYSSCVIIFSHVCHVQTAWVYSESSLAGGLYTTSHICHSFYTGENFHCKLLRQQKLKQKT